MTLHIRRNQPYNHQGSQVAPPRLPSSLLPQQGGEFKQLGEAKMRGLPHRHGRVFGHQTGPLRRDRPQLLLIVEEVDPVLAPVVAPSDEAKLAAAEWVERMSDLETFCRIVPIDCSRQRTRTERQSVSSVVFGGSCWITWSS